MSLKKLTDHLNFLLLKRIPHFNEKKLGQAMNITLSNYHPFDYTKSLIDLAYKQPTDNWREVAQKISLIALVVIAILPTLIVDALLSAIQALCRCCCPPLPTLPVPHNFSWPPPPPPSPRRPPAPNPIEPIVPPAPITNGDQPPLTRQQIDAVLQPCRGGLTDAEFFKKSVERALRDLAPEQRNLYGQLLRNHGELDEDTDQGPPINVYQWSAACLLTSLMITHRDMGYDLDRGSFLEFTRQERAAIILQTRMPESKWGLSAAGKKFVEDLRAQASRMTQNQAFLELYKEIYPVNGLPY